MKSDARSGAGERASAWRRKRVAWEARLANVAHQSNDPEDKGSKDAKRDQEQKEGLYDAITCDGRGIGDSHGAEHGDNVVADGGIFRKPGSAQKIDEIVANTCAGSHVDVAEEVDDVVVCLSCNLHAAEEDDDVVLGRAIHFHGAEKADGIMHGLPMRDKDVACELDSVTTGMSRRGGEESYCGQQEECGRSGVIHRTSGSVYAKTSEVVP